MLEAHFHSFSHFTTFTYAEPPAGNSLRKSEFAAAMHRLRDLSRRDNKKMRFYGVGEYGDKYGRPHYHAAIYGLTQEDTKLIDRCWAPSASDNLPGAGVRGTIYHGVLTPDSASYVAGYITSKLAKTGHPELDGREPQFALMSRNPGIGLQAIKPLLEILQSPAGQKYLAEHYDVPTSFYVFGKTLPLGQHIRHVLRECLWGDSKQPPAAKAEKERLFHENIKAYLPPLRLDAAPGQVELAAIAAHLDSYSSWHSTLNQKALTVAKRHSINRSRKKL